MPLQVRAALRRFVADSLSWRRAALIMILMLACWSGEGFAQKVLSVTPTDCKYKISSNPEAVGPGWAQPGFDDSGWASSLPAADSYLPPGLISGLVAGSIFGRSRRRDRCLCRLRNFPVASSSGWERAWLLRQPRDGPIFHEPRATVSAPTAESRSRRGFGRLARNPAGVPSPPLLGHGRTHQRWIATDADRPNLHLLRVFRHWRYIPAHFVQRGSQQEGSLLAGHTCFRHPGPEDQ